MNRLCLFSYRKLSFRSAPRRGFNCIFQDKTFPSFSRKGFYTEKRKGTKENGIFLRGLRSQIFKVEQCFQPVYSSSVMQVQAGWKHCPTLTNYWAKFNEVLFGMNRYSNHDYKWTKSPFFPPLSPCEKKYPPSDHSANPTPPIRSPCL